MPVAIGDPGEAAVRAHPFSARASPLGPYHQEKTR